MDTQANLEIHKILVVDDEKDVKVLFEQRFRKEMKNGEMHFAFAFSGEEALQYLGQYSHEAVLILSDWNERPGTAPANQGKTSSTSSGSNDDNGLW